MKRLAILALAALLLVPVSVNAQRKNENLGKKYGPYEVKIGKGKYMKDAPVTAICCPLPMWSSSRERIILPKLRGW